MRKQTITFDSPLDALVAVTKRLSLYEAEAGMDSADFLRATQGESPKTTSDRSSGRTTTVTFSH